MLGLSMIELDFLSRLKVKPEKLRFASCPVNGRLDSSALESLLDSWDDLILIPLSLFFPMSIIITLQDC